jgi:hypothetical protein
MSLTNSSPDFFISRKDAGKDSLTPKEMLDFRTNWLEIERHKHPDVDTGVLRPAIKVRSHLQSIADSTEVQVNFDAVVHTGTDASEPTLGGSPGVVTINLNGIYHVTFSPLFDTLPLDIETFQVELEHNGADVDDGNAGLFWQIFQSASDANARINPNVSTDIACQVGDTLGAAVQVSSLSATAINLRLSFLSIHYAAPWSP